MPVAFADDWEWHTLPLLLPHAMHTHWVATERCCPKTAIARSKISFRNWKILYTDQLFFNLQEDLE